MTKLLIVSHYAKNAGTTDYLVQDLCANQKTFKYLRHPLPGTGLFRSELLTFDKGKLIISKQYVIIRNEYLRLFYDALLTLTFALKCRIIDGNKQIVAFGSFNSAVLTPLRLLKVNLIFWGVDYSDDRFTNNFLNKIYSLSETLACLFSNFTIQPSKLQAEKRLTNHKLKEDRSLIIPNGVVEHNVNVNLNKNSSIDAVYIGSLSKYHGVKQFLKQIVLLENINAIHIFGDGDELEDILKLQKQYTEGKIRIYGSLAFSQIQEILLRIPCKLIGAAPYLNSGHVVYGDSLKIKEYVSLGMPFISSNNIKIDSDLKQFGFIYKSGDHVAQIINNKISDFEVNYPLRDKIISKYTWKNIFNEKFYPILKTEGSN